MSSPYYYIDPEFNKFSPMYGDGQLYNDFENNLTKTPDEPEWLNDFPEDEYYNCILTTVEDNTYATGQGDFSDDEYVYSHYDLE